MHDYTTPNEGTFQSQHGEDVWLDNYFQSKQNGFFVEVGAYDGVVLSNTYHFEIARGWKGILVEPDAVKAASCRKNRPNATVYECAAVSSPKKTSVSFFQVQGGEVYSTANLTHAHKQRLEGYKLHYQEVRVSAKTLDQILTEVDPTSIDVLSIDVEEGELDVLKGFTIDHWKPSIVIVESNSSMRNPEVVNYFVRNGYAIKHVIACNHFYAPALRFNAAIARISDWMKYSWISAHRMNFTKIPTQRIRRILDRHILWRFRK